MKSLTFPKGFPKGKKPKKQSKTALTKKCDALFSKNIRSVGVCMLAGKDFLTCNGQLQCMHIIGRANRRLRWDSHNAIAGCQKHHLYYTWHPTEWALFISKHFPEKWEYVRQHHFEIMKPNYEVLIHELEQGNL